MSVLIKGGRIITAADDYVGDVFVDNGTVTMIGESLDIPEGTVKSRINRGRRELARRLRAMGVTA